MQDTDQTQPAAEEAWVTCQLLSSFSRGSEERRVDEFLMAARHRPELAGQREGE